MNRRAVTGLLLLAAAAGLGWLLYRRRQTVDAKTGFGSEPLSIGQLGGNVTQDSTPEIVKMTLDYAAQVNRGCWVQTGGKDGFWFWRNTATGDTDTLVAGTEPANVCRRQAP